MIISYEDYFGSYCIFPLFMICMFCLLLVYGGNLLRKCIRDRETSAKKILEAVLPFGMSVVIIIQIGSILICNGNLFLLMEKEEDAVTICGTIESIEPVDGTLYGQHDMYELLINHTECSAIYTRSENPTAKTPFKAGDYVEVLYLPRSGYILSIEELDSP